MAAPPGTPKRTRKNPENKPLRIVAAGGGLMDMHYGYTEILGQMLIAQAILAKSKSSAMPHFIAIVKELERLYGFRFEQIAEDSDGMEN